MLKLLNKDLQGLVMCHRFVQDSIWVGCSGLDEVGLLQKSVSFSRKKLYVPMCESLTRAVEL